jgi:long-subunit fatty acid transport protein
MRKIALFALLITLVTAGPVLAQTKVATSAAQFLKIGAGCRAAALGGAYVAMADDAAALFWNPSGLARLNRSEILFMHAQWLADTDYNFGGVVVNFGGSALGAFISTLGYGEWEVTTVDEPDGTGEIFEASDMALGAS